ncbi:MAG: enoyl-CoA hydratase-related protein [Pacificimonas sp.]|jgi:enoyl-CoA hydratase/carnithine racemase|nr:enoyl-CoA hydratase-related protein [Pacificimonas sp.]
MTDHVKTSLDGHVLTLTLDRAEKKNALTEPMYGALADGIERADADDNIRVVLFKSTSDAFTAGNDISSFAATAAGEAPKGPRQVDRFLKALARAETPLVAAVSGLAVGVGTTMLLHCDLVYMANHATLSTPFIDLALVPEAASSITLPAAIGHVRAFEMFALGKRVTAEEALSWGLVNGTCDLADLDRTATEAATALAQRAPTAVKLSKQLMRNPAALAARMDEEGVHFGAQLKSEEAKERFAAFAARSQKRA